MSFHDSPCSASWVCLWVRRSTKERPESSTWSWVYSCVTSWCCRLCRLIFSWGLGGGRGGGGSPNKPLLSPGFIGAPSPPLPSPSLPPFPPPPLPPIFAWELKSNHLKGARHTNPEPNTWYPLLNHGSGQGLLCHGSLPSHLEHCD